jgi:hypothetical protein
MRPRVSLFLLSLIFIWTNYGLAHTCDEFDDLKDTLNLVNMTILIKQKEYAKTVTEASGRGITNKIIEAQIVLRLDLKVLEGMKKRLDRSVRKLESTCPKGKKPSSPSLE